MTSIGEKADYVRQRLGPSRNHACHWPGCTTMVSPSSWGCRTHWYRLPGRLRTKVWNTFRPGQEISKTPSRAYVEVAREIQDWIREHDQQ